MKIKTRKYLNEIKKAEQRGYKKGLLEGENKVWKMEREARREEQIDKFMAETEKRLAELGENIRRLQQSGDGGEF